MSADGRTGGGERATTGRTLVAGDASGPVLALEEPLSFWGGLDPATGKVIDPHHPQRGAIVTETVLVMPAGRGSSSSSSVLAEAIRRRTGPAAIVLGEPDPIVALGALIAEELYEVRVPVAFVGPDVVAYLRRAPSVSVHATGTGLALDVGTNDASR